MTPERRERIEQICEAALDRDASARAAFLAHACAGDEALRREVESLLAHEHAAEHFIETPALQSAAESLTALVGVAPGERIGSYEVVSLLGSGGMGDVYRARDPQLSRDVAIKVLPPIFSTDPERMIRFEREARVLASLNHPNIGAIYGLERTAVSRALVLELVEGPTLADRLGDAARHNGPGLALPDALAIGRQIASALEAAHAKGIVHRDLKPANIKITPDGTVKVLDFGLAKLAVQAEAGSEPHGSDAPRVTVTGPREGVVLGTAAYMSPEQARGHAIDKRTDIWAFGCVLYEMLTGRAAFARETVADTMAAVVNADPDWSRLPADTPGSIRRLLRRCLRKPREGRLRDIGDAALELEEAQRSSHPDRRKVDGWPRQPFPVMLLAAGLIVAVGTLALMLWGPSTTTPGPATMRLSAELGADATLVRPDAPFALSADGTLLAFAARTSGSVPHLFVRRLDQFTATPLLGTDGASSPFFSPDGQWLAFFAGLKLKKVLVSGGAVWTLADAINPRGGWWAEDDTIVFSPTAREGLMRVSANGGQTEPLTTLVENEISHRFPQVLPGGQAVLYTASTEVNIGAGAFLVVQPLPSGQRIVVHRGGFFGRYLASGHIVYIQDDTLFAMPFDGQRLEVTGPAGRAIDGIQSDGSRGSAQLAVSEMGTLAYLPGQNLYGASPIAWMDRNGMLTPLRAAPADWSNPDFSPDGHRLAMDIRGDGHTDIWVYEWAGDRLTPVTTDTTNETRPIWTSDGGRIVYRSFGSSRNPAGHTLSWKRADGTGDAQVLVESDAALIPGSWHPTQNLLAYVAETTTGAEDVMILPVEGDEIRGWKPGQPMAFVNSPARERGPVFSPDGRWLAYHSTASGRDEVYVQPFPGPGSRVTVSSAVPPGLHADGETPSWSRTRSELVFTTPGLDYRRVLMVAPYRVENNSFRADKPRPWVEPSVALRLLAGERNYALHPDGVRVAIAPPPEGEEVGQAHVALVFNFFDALRGIAPPKP